MRARAEHAQTGGRRQFTITVSPELGKYLEERSAETGMNKSAVVSSALEADKERQEEELMREGYEEMAAHDRALLKEFEHVDRESAASWPEY
jgi:hypothetical protein